MFARLRIPRVGMAVSAAAAKPFRQQRSLHFVPQLAHDFKDGVPGLLSAGGYDMAWTQYMKLMLDKLNALTAGTDLEHRDVKQILLATARDPAQAPVFNHASMAHNTHFFFKNLTPTPKPMPELLARELTHSFSSIETLRREMIITACTMFGPGFVWLIKANHQDYRIVTTYLAGSPYPGAHWRLQSTDMNTVGLGGTAKHFFQQSGNAQKTGVRPPGALDAIPLLCLNTWEHMWLRDYGFGVDGVGGKRAYAEAWWEVVDWEAVMAMADIHTRPGFIR